jgi:hypothetical protein
VPVTRAYEPVAASIRSEVARPLREVLAERGVDCRRAS